MASSIHKVFWTGTALAALALLVAFLLPRSSDPTITPPDEQTCRPETGERMVIAEFTTLDLEDEPIASKGT